MPRGKNKIAIDPFSKKLSGASLPYAVMLMTLLITSLTLLLFVVYLYRSYIIKLECKQIAALNLKSAQQIALAEETDHSLNNRQIFSMNNSDNDTVILERELWGCYTLLKTFVKFSGEERQSVFFAGNYYSTDSLTSLRISSTGTGLSLVGNCMLTGKVVVPKAQVNPGFVGNISFTGDTLVHGIISESVGDNPPVDSALKKNCSFDFYRLLLNNNFDLDIVYGSLARYDSLYRSFYSPPLYLYSRDELTINNVKVHGHILIFSESRIRLSANADVEDVVIVAPVIKIDSGFSGSVQCIASDSILCMKGSKLTYPSMIGCGLRKEKDIEGESMPVIIFEGLLEGTIICESYGTDTKKASLIIGKTGKVIGLVHNTGYTVLMGKIYGSCISRGFLYQDPVTLYENYLVNSEINPRKIPLGFVAANSIRNNHVLYRIMKWLY